MYVGNREIWGGGGWGGARERERDGKGEEEGERAREIDRQRSLKMSQLTITPDHGPLPLKPKLLDVRIRIFSVHA